MSIFIIQPNDYFIDNLAIRFYKLYDNKKRTQYYIETPPIDPNDPTDPNNDPDYDIYLKAYLINNVNVIVPNHGQFTVNILDNLITWAEFVQLELTDDDILNYSSKIQLSDIATYTSTMYIKWDELIAQYCWYSFAIYFEKYVSPTIVITDWLAQYLTIDTVWSQYYKVDFDKIPEIIPIPTYDDLIQIPVPDSMGLLNKSDSGNYYVTSIGGMTSTAILSSILFTRKKIIDIGIGIKELIVNLTTLRSAVVMTSSGMTSLQTLIGNLSTSLTSLQTTSTSNTSDIASIQSSLSSTLTSLSTLESDITSLQTTSTSNASDMSSVQSSLSSTITSLSTLQSDISTLQSSMTTNTSNITALQSSLSSLATTVTSHTTSIASLRSTNTTSSADITTLRNAINNNSSDIASLQSSVNTLSSSIYTLQSTVSSHTTSINKNTSDITALKTSLNSVLGLLRLPTLA